MRDCLDPQFTLDPILVTDNFFDLTAQLKNKCFAWNVITNCPKDDTPPELDWNCYRPDYCIAPKKRSLQGNFAPNTNTVYPNPIKIGETLSFPIQYVEEATFIQVLDVNGKIVKSFTPSTNKVTIDAQWSKGVHFLKINTGTNTIINKFLIY